MAEYCCLSNRPDQLLRWRQAFPDGRICLSLEELMSAEPASLVWFHVSSWSQGCLDEAVTILRKRFPDARLVAISNLPEEQEALLAFNAGAVGYCHAQATPQIFKQVALVVHNGGLWIGAELMKRMLGAAGQALAPRSRAELSPHLDRLTPREREVALAVGRGAANKEIAQGLHITERTVKAHMGSIFEKLGIRDRLQLLLLLSQE